MKRHFVARLVNSKVFLPLLAGGMAMQLSLSGCDAEVRDTLLTGIQSSVTGLFSAAMNAFFLSFQDAANNSATTQSVQAVFENLATWLA